MLVLAIADLNSTLSPNQTVFIPLSATETRACLTLMKKDTGTRQPQEYNCIHYGEGYWTRVTLIPGMSDSVQSSMASVPQIVLTLDSSVVH